MNPVYLPSINKKLVCQFCTQKMSTFKNFVCFEHKFGFHSCDECQDVMDLVTSHWLENDAWAGLASGEKRMLINGFEYELNQYCRMHIEFNDEIYVSVVEIATGKVSYERINNMSRYDSSMKSINIKA